MQGIGIEPLSCEALDHGIGMLCRLGAFGFLRRTQYSVFEGSALDGRVERDDPVAPGQRAFCRGDLVSGQVGQPGGEVEVIHSFGIKAAMDARRNENVAKEQVHAFSIAMALLPVASGKQAEREVALDGLFGDRFAKGTRKKSLQHAADEVLPRLPFVGSSGDFELSFLSLEVGWTLDQLRGAFYGQVVNLHGRPLGVIEIAEAVRNRGLALAGGKFEERLLANAESGV